MSKVWYLPTPDAFWNHIPKCAGRSITTWLQTNIINLSGCGGDTSHYEKNNWKNTFTSIRNPFDRLVSFYKSLVGAGELPLVVQQSDISFSRYVHKIIEIDDVIPDFNTMNQGTIIKDDPNGHWDNVARIHTAPLTHVYNSADKFEDHVRFENLEADWLGIVQKYNLVNMQQYRMLPHNNKSVGMDYWQYYDNTTRGVVEEYFKEDLLTFNYKF